LNRGQRLGATLGPLLAILGITLCCAAAPASEKVSFKGRIVAYRPADRLQVVSFVSNKEVLLFQRAGAGREWVKLVYVHQGFSKFSGDVLSGVHPISVLVRRDPACDQSFGELLEDAPVVRWEGSSKEAMQRVVFAASVPRPPKSYRLRCYALDSWTPLKVSQK
jgi:hypothetical protein